MGFDSSVFRQISKGKEKQMNTVIFENKITKERYVCDDLRFVRWFDGEEFVSVRRVNETRTFLIRRSALTEVREHVKFWVVSLMVEPRFYTAMTAVQFCHDLPLPL